MLSIKDSIIYGPVNSRRLGRSLGINLMPRKYKLCSFNCIYCHYGWTRDTVMDLSPHRADLPVLADILEVIEKAFQSSSEFDYITFSGSGESTLYPEFPELVQELIKLRDSYRPDVKTALLSNSSGLIYENVRKCIKNIDLPVFKLDAGTVKTFKAINQPSNEIIYEKIIESLIPIEGIYLQTLLLDGIISNIKEDELQEYFSRIREIRPLEVHIYSIDRPVPAKRLIKVPPDKLKEIRIMAEKETGIKFRAFYQE